MKAWTARFATGGYLLAVVVAALGSAIAFRAQARQRRRVAAADDPAARDVLPGACSRWRWSTSRGGETVAGASRFIAGLLQLLVVLFAAFGGQLVGEQILDSTLSGFVGAAAMVPVARVVARARSAPPAHVMFLPAFWMLVPGAIGLIGITEIVGENAEAGTTNFVRALVSIPSVALGILVGTLIVRGVGSIRRPQRRIT